MAQFDPIITLSRVSKSFGSVRAVDDVSMQIGKGEFFAILGPSGCGKTTLLRLLGGFEIPTAGEIYIDGEEVSGMSPNKRPSNMVFQNYAIFPHLNVRQNIAYGLSNKGMTKAQIDEIVDGMLELIRLPGYGARAAHQLSGGQRQRVALARALVCKPKVLLLDEPLGALDKKLREEMQIELRQIQGTVGITFVFVTHDQEEALTMADRIAVMARGKIVQVDMSGALYETPSCTEVAEFIGTINLFPGTVDGVGDTVTIDVGAVGRLSVQKGRSDVRRGDKALLAVRPEKLRLAQEAPGSGYNAVRGRLVAESYVGDRSYYFVEVHGLSRRLAVAMLNERRSIDRSSLHGPNGVWVVWPIESGVLLTS
ncbi:MAG: ABC transporter ATP-binding protein [Candidatus Rokubacteria bacterium]|nr:ABC transporter ATP-binding protein [Candidatus Rokubacteria bacterium]